MKISKYAIKSAIVAIIILTIATIGSLYLNRLL